jgi:hypothetical protein
MREKQKLCKKKLAACGAGLILSMTRKHSSEQTTVQSNVVLKNEAYFMINILFFLLSRTLFQMT